jgi:hypothetical protein
MANTFKLRTKSNIGIVTTAVYTVPASTTTVVIGITLANISSSNVNAGIGISRVSSDNISLLKNAPIPYGSSLEFMGGNKIVLETTDIINIVSDTANSIDAAITIMEIT